MAKPRHRPKHAGSRRWRHRGPRPSWPTSATRSPLPCCPACSPPPSAPRLRPRTHRGLSDGLAGVACLASEAIADDPAAAVLFSLIGGHGLLATLAVIYAI